MIGFSELKTMCVVYRDLCKGGRQHRKMRCELQLPCWHLRQGIEFVMTFGGVDLLYHDSFK